MRKKRNRPNKYLYRTRGTDAPLACELKCLELLGFMNKEKLMISSHNSV